MRHYCGRGGFLEPVARNIDRQQKQFFAEGSNNRRVGDFYELVTAGIFGGRTKNYVYVEADEEGRLSGEGIVDWRVFGNGSGKVNGVMPDVKDDKRKRMFEAKALFIGSDCILRDTQIESYKYLQLKNPDYSLFVALYKHAVPEIKKFKGADDELTYELAMRTKFSVILPLSIGIHLHDYRGRGIYRYDIENKRPGTYFESPPATHILSGTINDILVDPEGFIQRVGLNPEDYRVSRKMSPLEYKVLGNTVKPFPILWVQDKDPSLWMERFSRMSVQTELFEEAVPFDIGDEEEYDPRADGCSDEAVESREEF